MEEGATESQGRRDYCRCAEAPAAISRKALTNPAAASGSASASSCTVAENCGDSGRKRTCKMSGRRADISAFNSALGSCFQCVRVVRMMGPGWYRSHSRWSRLRDRNRAVRISATACAADAT